MVGKKRGLVILDEFGDGFTLHREYIEGKWRRYLDEETQGFLNLDQYFILPLENLVISMHPALLDPNNNRPVEGVIGKEEFSEHALHRVMRNTAGIVQHHKDLGYTNFTRCIPLTVEGPAPVQLKGNFNHTDFCRQCLKTVTSKQWIKFVCSYNGKFDRNLFIQELGTAGIKLFEYLRADQAVVNLESFLVAEAGCLLVPYTQLRGVESHSILYFADDVNDAGLTLLRCSADIILCFPENSVRVYNFGSGVRRIAGFREDPAAFRKLKETLGMFDTKHVVCLDEDLSRTEVELFKEAMKQGRFQISYTDDVPLSPNDLYSQLDGLEEGGVIVYTQTRKQLFNQLYIWLQRRNICSLRARCSKYAIIIDLFDRWPKFLNETDGVIFYIEIVYLF